MPTPKENIDTEAVVDPLDPVRESAKAFANKVEENVTTRVVSEITETLSGLTKPNLAKVPKPDTIKANSVKMLGYASDVLYMKLPEAERKIRNQGSDALVKQWLRAVKDNDGEFMRRYSDELNDLYLADEATEGTGGANGAIGSGTAADLIPGPVVAAIVEYRNRTAKLRRLAQVVTSPGPTIRVPRHGRMTAAQIAEANTQANQVHAFDTVLLEKKKMQTTFGITDEMLEDVPFALASFFFRRAGEAMGQLEDEWICSSVVTVPIESIGGETRVETLAGPRLLGYKDTQRLAFALGEQYTADATWFGNARTLTFLSTLLDSNGRQALVSYMDQPAVVGDQIPGNRGVLYNRPVIQLPLTSSGSSDARSDLWFANLREGLVIFDGGGLRIRSSDQAEFRTGVVLFKVSQRIDAAVVNSEAFARMTISGTVA